MIRKHQHQYNYDQPIYKSSSISGTEQNIGQRLDRLLDKLQEEHPSFQLVEIKTVSNPIIGRMDIVVIVIYTI